MKNYDLLIIETSGEVRFKRLSNNNTKGIIELFKENNLLDDIDEMYFIQITIQDEKDILKLKNSFKLVGDSLEFCNILTEGNILFVYKKALEKEMKNLISKHKFEDAVELKTTSKALTAIINSEDSNESQLETIRMYFKIRLNNISNKKYIIQSIEDGMEFEEGEWVDISEQVDIDDETFLFVISGEIKQGTSKYILQSIEDGMEFGVNEYIEELTETEYENIASGENKHKGEQVSPKIIWHKSSPFFRDKIDKEGLKVMKGDSYMSHSPEKSSPPAIFGYFGDIDYYDSTYDDDIWEIDTTKIPNVQWFIDKEVGVDVQSAVVTYQNIPRNAIKLIYKGTGEDLY